MSADSPPEEKKEASNTTEGSRWTIVTVLVTAAGVIATIIFSIIAALAAHDASVNAKNTQALFQGSDACRAIRTEILDLRQAGLNSTQITNVLMREQTSPSYYEIDPHGNALDEDNYECGARGPEQNTTVQYWIETISSVPVTANK